MSEELFYYIQNRGYVGNCLRFWCVDGHGYTCDLDQAWKVTKEKADSICASRPQEDTALSATLLDSVARRMVDVEVLRYHQRENQKGKLNGKT